MPIPFRPGDKVTIQPPYDRLPYILSMRRHVVVAAPTVTGDLAGTYVTVELDAVDESLRLQRVPAAQLARGWRDRGGRWL